MKFNDDATHFDLMAFDDESSQLLTIKKIIEKEFPKSKIHTTENAFMMLMEVSVKKPEVIIVDYHFKEYVITENKAIMKRLLSFQGFVIVYSSHCLSHIRQEILDKYDTVPKNFRFIEKTNNTMVLLNEVIRYKERRESGMPVHLAAISH